jgi:hypothetical protein
LSHARAAQPAKVDNFNAASLPFQLRLEDFEIAMQDIYDFFYDVKYLPA